MPADSPLLNTDGVLGVSIKLDGSPVSDTTQVASVRIEKAIGLIPEATVSILVNEIIADEAAELDGSSFAIGTAITIAAYYGDGEEQALFDGVIMATRLRIDERQGVRLELTCRDKAMALLGLRNSVLYGQQNDGDAMNGIIADAGLQADIVSTTDTAADQLRFAASDWEYLRILADRNGLVLNADAGKISAQAPDTDAEPPLIVTLGSDLIAVDLTVDAQSAVGAAEFSAWSPQDQEKVTGDGGSLPPGTLGSTASTTIAKVLGSRTFRAGTAGDFADADLGRMAKARLARSVLSSVHGHCRFQGSGAIQPGDMLEIAGTGAVFAGKVYVGGVSHEIEDGNWITEASLGLDPDWATDRFGAGGATTAGITAPHLGLQIGKVMTVAEDPDGKQRIKVSLPLVADPAAEIWARFAQPYASGGAGIQFMPEVDDEVVVGFLSADPNAAIVLGALHSANIAQAIAPEAENNLKGIITRAALRIDFDDDKKILKLSTPGGHSITMDDDAMELTLADMNGNSVTFSSSGIAIESDMDITITATGKVEATATQDATISGMNVTCIADIGFTAEGNATAELSASGSTTVKGGVVQIN